MDGSWVYQMIYKAYFTDGTPLEIGDSSIDSSTSLTFDGNNYHQYGEECWSNKIHLLEHFNSQFSPRNPIMGQLWYDSINKNLKVFSNTWNNLMIDPIDLSLYCHKADILESLEVIDPKNNLSIANKKYADNTFFELTGDINYIKYPNNYMVFYINVVENGNIKLPFMMDNLLYSVIASFNSIKTDKGNQILILNKKLDSFDVYADSTYESISIIVMGFTK